MLQFKRNKIQNYLSSLSSHTPFDELLQDYLDGKLKNTLEACGIERIDIHIDWLKDYRLIGIQAKYNGLFLDIQITESYYTFSQSTDEPDEDIELTLKSKEEFY